MTQQLHNQIQAARITALPCVAAFELHAETGSTQDHARAAALQPGQPLPSLFAAYLQTDGRGRGANRWWAGAGSLTFSWLIDPAAYQLHGAKIPAAAIATGAAICQSLNELAGLSGNQGCLLKWPNDIYLHGRKLGGVLMETIALPAAATTAAATAPQAGGGHSRLRMIAGIGLNINNSLQPAPAEVSQRAVSLADATGRTFSLTDALVSLLPAVDSALHRLAAGDPSQAAGWQELSVLTGRTVTVETGSSSGAVSCSGACAGIASDGALLLQSDSGLQRIISGIVTGICPSLQSPGL